MNTFNNKRRRETVRRIEEVFLDELKKNELSAIRVSDICKKAQINRSTFYANFIDIYDLADSILMRLKGEVIILLKQDIDLQKSEEGFLNLLQHIKENQSLYSFYFKLGYDRKEDFSICDFSVQTFGFDKELIKYHIVFFKNGFNAIVNEWLKVGCKETPEQIRDIILYEYRGRIMGD